MKRLPAILFLLILVFNFVGYQMVITFMERDNDAVLERKLDKQEYNNEELVSIKTALNLPYYTSSPEFERTYGSATINGVVYEYVKKRVYNDTLELLCLPNRVKTGLQEAKNELTKSSADGQASVPVKKAPSIPKISLPDFCQPLQTFSFAAMDTRQHYILRNETFSPSSHCRCPEHPPRSVQVAS